MLRVTAARVRTMSRASGRTTRSAYRCRTRVSSPSSLCRVGSGRSALLASTQEPPSTDSSPRRDEITRPVTETKSPRSTSAFHSARDSSPTSASDSITCSLIPESAAVKPSCKVAKQSLPVLRMKTTRPLTLTTSAVSSPATRCPHAACTCAALCVRGTAIG